MISSSALSLSSSPHPPPSEPKSDPSTPTSEPPSSPKQPPWTIKSSPQLNRWSRARAIRSGRKLTRQSEPPNGEITRSGSQVSIAADNSDGYGSDLQIPSPRSEGAIDGDSPREAPAGKSIYMVSDGTGWTVEHSVTAALGQFEHCLVDRVCPVNTHLFSGIDDMDRLMEVIAQAAKEGAMIIYTIADPSIAESARKACNLWGVPSLDVLGPITESLASHLKISPSGLGRWAPGRKAPLGEEYFRRIEAIEFTIKQDDGALPENLHKSDIILTGVSRTGKTPLSIYLAQKGYKVANVPIVMNLGLPSALFEVDPEKVFALTINHLVLRTIRRTRAKSLGFGADVETSYCEMDFVRKELEFAGNIFRENPVWPVIEVTGKAIEETAAILLRLYHDRKNRCKMPRISRRY